MKDLNYWKKNAEEDYIKTPISVLRYITELENKHETEQLNILGVSSSADYEAEINITRCPKCKSSDHLMITGEPYKCMDCGNKWI
jgi:DNA-directed RNA polymerase subunit M/transcription elongation factor TFIIS